MTKESYIEELIRTLQLAPLEAEGGMVRETYRGSLGSAIFYLLTGNGYSHLHRLQGDEMYHFYDGDPVELVELIPDGSVRVTVLGKDLAAGQKVQHLIPGGNWQGSCLLKKEDGYALLGTTMWPGYRNEEYEHGDREVLLSEYPEAEAYIMRLTGEPKYR